LPAAATRFDPLVVYGDITTNPDVDYYALRP